MQNLHIKCEFENDEDMCMEVLRFGHQIPEIDRMTIHHTLPPGHVMPTYVLGRNVFASRFSSTPGHTSSHNFNEKRGGMSDTFTFAAMFVDRLRVLLWALGKMSRDGYVNS